MTDPRTAAVEQNLFALWDLGLTHPMFRRSPADDALVFHSDVPFPLFNGVIQARFDDPARRTREVAGELIDAGLPWTWLLTPSTTSPELEAVLDELGLEREPVPGMYRELDAPAYTVRPPGVEVVRTHDADAYVEVMVAAFGMPEATAGPMAELIRRVPDAINVLAMLGGRPVACGSAFLDGPTAGLYNIASFPDSRGRGAGYAVTASLLDLAADAGAEHAILHSSADGLPLYTRLGFVEVCATPQYVWMPGN